MGKGGVSNFYLKVAWVLLPEVTELHKNDCFKNCEADVFLTFSCKLIDVFSCSLLDIEVMLYLSALAPN